MEVMRSGRIRICLEDRTKNLKKWFGVEKEIMPKFLP